MKFYRVINTSGGLNGTLWMVDPTRLTQFDTLYWANNMAGRNGQTVVDVPQGEFEDELNRLGMPGRAAILATGTVKTFSWAEEAVKILTGNAGLANIQALVNLSGTSVNTNINTTRTQILDAIEDLGETTGP